MTVTTERAWRDFSDRLRRFIGARIPSDAEADDVLSDVFVKVHANIDSLEDEERLAPWLFRITRNTITDYYRKRRPASRDMDGIDLAAEEDPKQAAESMGQAMRNMVDQLPDKYREAIVLTEYEGLTQKQLAERLGISPSGAKSRVQRARAQLRDELLACCHFEFDRRGGIVDYTPRPRCCAQVAG